MDKSVKEWLERKKQEIGDSPSVGQDYSLQKRADPEPLKAPEHKPSALSTPPERKPVFKPIPPVANTAPEKISDSTGSVSEIVSEPVHESSPEAETPVSNYQDFNEDIPSKPEENWNSSYDVKEKISRLMENKPEKPKKQMRVHFPVFPKPSLPKGKTIISRRRAMIILFSSMAGAMAGLAVVFLIL